MQIRFKNINSINSPKLCKRNNCAFNGNLNNKLIKDTVDIKGGLKKASKFASVALIAGGAFYALFASKTKKSEGTLVVHQYNPTDFDNKEKVSNVTITDKSKGTKYEKILSKLKNNVEEISQKSPTVLEEAKQIRDEVFESYEKCLNAPGGEYYDKERGVDVQLYHSSFIETDKNGKILRIASIKELQNPKNGLEIHQTNRMGRTSTYYFYQNRICASKDVDRTRDENGKIIDNFAGFGEQFYFVDDKLNVYAKKLPLKNSQPYTHYTFNRDGKLVSYIRNDEGANIYFDHTNTKNVVTL